MMTTALVVLALAGVALVVRVLVGPSLADRVVALDGVLIVVIGALAVNAARTGTGLFIDVAVVIGLVGFVTTGIAARFIERRGA